MALPPVVEQIRRAQTLPPAETEVPDFPRIEKVAGLLCGLPPGRLLDAGYTRGSFADLLAQKGWRCVGLDLHAPASGKIPFVQCDLHEGLPFGPESFDVVTAGEVIEHVIDQEFFLRECHRVLKRNGRLVLTTPNLAFSINRLLVLIGRTPLFVTAPYHYHFHTRKTLCDLVRAQGFQIEKIRSSHLLYSRRRHPTGWLFERLGDFFPSLGAHLILRARRP